MASAVVLRGDIAGKAIIVDLEGAAAAIPSGGVAASGGPSRVRCADVTGVALDRPQRAGEGFREHLVAVEARRPW